MKSVEVGNTQNPNITFLKRLPSVRKIEPGQWETLMEETRSEGSLVEQAEQRDRYRWHTLREINDPCWETEV